jgi:hypothetical protein
MYVDIVVSAMGAEMWRNIQYGKNIINLSVGLQSLSIVDH